MTAAHPIDPQVLANLRKHEVGRYLFENLVQNLPGAAAGVQFARFAYPSRLQKALDAQRDNLVSSSIEHDQRIEFLESLVTSRSRISIRGVAMGKAACLLSTAEFREELPLATIKSATDLGDDDWDEALVEFKANDLAYFGLSTLKLSWRAYCLFDPLFRGTDPVLDAATIAELAANARQKPDFDEVAEATGLDQRRINPALLFLSRATDGAVRRTINGEWLFLCPPLSGWDASMRYKFRRVQADANAIALDMLKQPPENET